MTTKTYRTRTELIQILRDRDGDMCQHPDHDHVLDFEVVDGPRLVTIDHREPQSWCRENGWTEDEIWDPSNLSLMCKKGNAAKGNLRYNADGTLPAKTTSTFKYRRQKRAERPEVCNSCNSGRNLEDGQHCNACGSGPMPERFPRWRQMSAKECDHDIFFCNMCFLGFTPRRSSLDSLLTGGDGYQ